MTEVLVLVDGARPPTKAPPSTTPLELTTEGPNANVTLRGDVFRTKLLQELPDRLDDLLRLATFVYSADIRVSRGTEKDVFASNWVRSFRMVLPVWELDYWQDESVKTALSDTLSFLTGDEFSFDFVQRTNRKVKQGIFDFKEPIHPLPQVDEVISFSGGSDSLAAVLLAMKEGRHPILVSHRPTPPIDSRQKNLVKCLESRFPSWAFPHVSMWAHRKGGKRPADFSQRSRSFLYTALSVITAAILRLDDVRVCDNGIVSINLPQSGSNYGSFLSRSTHPRYAALAQNLLRSVTDRDKLSISNDLLLYTKRETLEVIADSGFPELLQETVSCAHVEGKSKLKPHCGVCTQCIDRRFASEAAGLTTHDLPSRYEVDIFTDPLKEGIDRTHAENYVRFAGSLEDIFDADHFFKTYPELVDCLPQEGDVDQAGEALWELFQRHQSSVNSVLEAKIKDYAKEIRRASLPPECLLRMVANGQYASDLRARYADSLKDLLQKSLPAAFQTNKAKDERNVQDVGEAVFQAAQVTLQRESPQIPFSVVTTKPDFADVPTEGVPLFLEFKYIKDRRRLNGIVTEMTSRVTVYKTQGASILFIVYDPNHAIVDDDKFCGDFTKHKGVFVGIVR